MHAITHGPRFPIKDGSAFIVGSRELTLCSRFITRLSSSWERRNQDALERRTASIPTAEIGHSIMLRVFPESSESLIIKGRTFRSRVALRCVVLCCD